MREILRADPIVFADSVVRLREEALNFLYEVLLGWLELLA